MAGWWKGRDPEVATQWAAYLFVKEWGRREGIDSKRLESMVLRGPDPRCIVELAKAVPGVNLRRAAEEVADRGDAVQIRRMMRVPGVDPRRLERTLVIAEVMGT